MKSLKVVTLVLFLAWVGIFTKNNIAAHAREVSWQHASPATRAKVTGIEKEFSTLQQGDLIQIDGKTLFVKGADDRCVEVYDSLGFPAYSICDLRGAARELPTIVRTNDGVTYDRALLMFVKQ